MENNYNPNTGFNLFEDLHNFAKLAFGKDPYGKNDFYILVKPKEIIKPESEVFTENNDKPNTGFNLFEDLHNFAKLAFGKDPYGIIEKSKAAKSETAPKAILENKYKANTEYAKSLFSESVKEIKDVFKEMYIFGKLVFSKNILEGIHKEKLRLEDIQKEKSRLENLVK